MGPPDPLTTDSGRRFFGQGTLGLGESVHGRLVGRRRPWPSSSIASLRSRVARGRPTSPPTSIWQVAQARFFNMQNIARSQARRRDALQRDRGLQGLARQPHDRLVRLLAGRRHQRRRRAGSQARPGLPQDRRCSRARRSGTSAAAGAPSWALPPKNTARTASASPSRPTRPPMAASATSTCRSSSRSRTTACSTGKADHVVSMGMFEHVGHKNYRAYFEKARSVIKDDGLFMMHTVGSQWTTETIEPWLEKYIFPGGVIPSIAQIGKAIDGLFTRHRRPQYRAALRQDAGRLVRELRAQLETGPQPRGGTLLPAVEVLPALLRRRFPLPGAAGLAVRPRPPAACPTATSPSVDGMNPRLISALLLAFLIGGAVYLWLRPADAPPVATTTPAPPETASEPKPSTGSKTSDQFLILAASWQPAFCEGCSGKPECRQQSRTASTPTTSRCTDCGRTGRVLRRLQQARTA